MALQYVQLGRAGLRLSNLCLGCLNFGWRTPESEAVRMIHRALDAGINFFDTANEYAEGRSEMIVGQALKERRDQVVIATKGGIDIGEGPNERGASRQHLMREVDRSLRRLGTDYIDLYQIHRPDPQTPIEESLRTLDDLVRAGKIRYFGISQYPAWQVVEALWASDRLNLERIVSIQSLYSILHREAEVEVLPVCARYGVGFLAYGALSFGLLTGKYRAGEPFPADTRGAARNWPRENPIFRRDFKRALSIVPLAAAEGVTPSQAAIAWSLSRPGITSVLIGPRTMEQLNEHLLALDVRLSEEYFKAVDKVGESEA